jgi:hypothetical protein
MSYDHVIYAKLIEIVSQSESRSVPSECTHHPFQPCGYVLIARYAVSDKILVF